MTQLSELISEILDENGDSLDYISKTSKIGLITLNRIKTGEKMPSKEQLNILCDVLRLSQSDIKSIKNLYQIEKFGKLEYDKHCRIKMALEKLSGFVDKEASMRRQKDGFCQEKGQHIFRNEKSGSIILNGEAEIRFFIAGMIDKECQHSDSEVRLQISRGGLNINQLVRERLFKQAKKTRVSEIIDLPEQPDTETELFEELPNLLDLSLLHSVQLETHYRYGQRETYTIQEAGLRNCLLTSDACLLFADDWESAVCHLDHHLVAFFGKKFDEIFRLSDDLFEVRNYERGQNTFDGLTKKGISQNEQALFSKAYLKVYLDERAAVSQNEWVKSLIQQSDEEKRSVYVNDEQHFSLSGAIGIFSTPVKSWIHLIDQNTETFLTFLEERLIKSMNCFLSSLVECELALEIAHVQSAEQKKRLK
ncbi:MAG: hypothetical protein PWP62_1306 [Eubacteriaceae bacterium]|jgi:hypothetical protein|nr:hypothetical protein [Eubacteriaceae bacterium]